VAPFLMAHGALSPVHTGDCSRRFRRQSVAEFGDYSLQCGQAISPIWGGHPWDTLPTPWATRSRRCGCRCLVFKLLA